MSLASDIRALGAPEWYIEHVEKTTAKEFYLQDLLRPLILAHTHTQALNSRLMNQSYKLERERLALRGRVTRLTKEKLGWEATNHKRNEYILGLKARSALLEGQAAHRSVITVTSERETGLAANNKQLTTRVRGLESQVETLQRALVEEEAAREAVSKQAKEWKAKYQERKSLDFGVAYGMSGAQAAECLRPRAPEPALHFTSKTSWALGDRVRIAEGIEGEVHGITRREGVLVAVSILVPGKPGVRTVHSLTAGGALR